MESAQQATDRRASNDASRPRRRAVAAPATRRRAKRARPPAVRDPGRHRRRSRWSASAATRSLTAGRESTDDAQVAADIVPVSARASAAWSRACAIHENQLVKSGDLLVEIDAADYAARVAAGRGRAGDRAGAGRRPPTRRCTIVEATSKGGLASARAALAGSTARRRERRRAARRRARRGCARRGRRCTRPRSISSAPATLRKADAVPQERLDNAQIAFDGARGRQAAGRRAGGAGRGRAPRRRRAASARRAAA